MSMMGKKYALEYVMYENLTDRLNFDIVRYGIDGTRFEMGKGFIITVTDAIIHQKNLI